MRGSGATMPRKTAFTLIELLVVVAIISLLVAILVPALKKAPDLAQSTVCLSNEHQISIAMATYQSDYDGYYAAGHSAGAVGPAVQTRLSPYMGGIDDAKQDVDNPKGFWICPTDPGPKGLGTSGSYMTWKWVHNQYEFNSYAMAVADNIGGPYDPYGLFPYYPTAGVKVRKDNDIQSPSRTLMFVEANLTREMSYFATWAGTNSGYPLDPYHNDGTEVNILACDGSAIRFSDFALTIPPYNMTEWCLPAYWYRIDQ